MSKVWFITGCSRGFGRSLAKEVLEKGDQLIATARKPEQLDDFVKQYGNQVCVLPLDVTNVEQVNAAVKTAINVFGRLDVVVNNAGYANSSPIEEMEEADFRAQIETNLFGVVNVTKAALPILREQRSGHFVQFSSIGGRIGGTPGMGAYQTAKHAVEGFSKVLSNEVKPFGIKVTLIEPGAFRTDWNGASMLRPEVGEDYKATVGAMNQLREQFEGSQSGDPARAAKIITDIVQMDEPPFQLLLGSDAVKSAMEDSKNSALEIEKWADVSRSADFPTNS